VQEDADGDGLSDTLENTTCTDPFDADTDNDGISDGAEDLNKNGVVDSGETDPCNNDTDGDGMPDGWEVAHGLDPTSGEGIDGANGDINGDGLSNLQEYLDGMYYSANSAEIIDPPEGTISSTSATIHISGNGVVAYQYRLDAGIWQMQASIDTVVELTDLSDGVHTLHVIGKDQNGYWQSEGSATTASWTVSTEPTIYPLPKDNWSILYVDSEETNVVKDLRAVNAIDDNPATIWHTEWKNDDPM